MRHRHCGATTDTWGTRIRDGLARMHGRGVHCCVQPYAGARVYWGGARAHLMCMLAALAPGILTNGHSRACRWPWRALVAAAVRVVLWLSLPFPPVHAAAASRTDFRCTPPSGVLRASACPSEGLVSARVTSPGWPGDICVRALAVCASCACVCECACACTCPPPCRARVRQAPGLPCVYTGMQVCVAVCTCLFGPRPCTCTTCHVRVQGVVCVAP
jgi:hypothetical protein